MPPPVCIGLTVDRPLFERTACNVLVHVGFMIHDKTNRLKILVHHSSLRSVRAAQRATLGTTPLSMSACKASRTRCRRDDDKPPSSSLSVPGIRVSLLPELTRRERGTFSHCLELSEYHVRIDRCLPDPGAVAAIAACNHIFTSNTFGITP